MARLTAAMLGMVADRLLENGPDAFVVAIDSHGLFVPMPESVPLRGNRVIHGATSALELVVEGYLIPVIDAWTLAVADGVSNVMVHLLDNPDVEVALHYVDLREVPGSISAS
jgi:hypothetical protein